MISDQDIVEQRNKIRFYNTTVGQLQSTLDRFSVRENHVTTITNSVTTEQHKYTSIIDNLRPFFFFRLHLNDSSPDFKIKSNKKKRGP